MRLSSQHPRGLTVLFSTEMWERFNFYGMRTIMALYMVSALNFTEGSASKYYGAYLGLGYLSTMLGGYLADKHWGNVICLYVGSIVMFLGQLSFFISASVFSSDLQLATYVFWIGLFLLIIGTGIFKPNISSMVGDLYPANDSRLDNAYTIFYMGINLGALLGQFICSNLGDKTTLVNGELVRTAQDMQAFRWGFLAAAIAMFSGLCSFYFFRKYVRNPKGELIGKRIKSHKAVNHEVLNNNFKRNLIVTLITLVLSAGFYFLLKENDGSGLLENFSVIALVYALIYALAISLTLSVLTNKSLSKIERNKIAVLIICAFFVIFFWAAFEQAGSSLTFIANNQTDTVIFGYKMPPSQIQIFNALFIIILAPLTVAFWSWLRKYGKEPNSFVKLGLGLLFLALGYYVIAWVVRGLGDSEKIALIWFIILYFLHTTGELCLSPIGLSLVYKLSPRRIVGLLLGIWFLSSSAGYALAGTLGALLPPNPGQFQLANKNNLDLQGFLTGKLQPNSEQLELLKQLNLPTHYPSILGIEITNLYQFFMVFVILSATAGLLVLLISKRLFKASSVEEAG